MNTTQPTLLSASIKPAGSSADGVVSVEIKAQVPGSNWEVKLVEADGDLIFDIAQNPRVHDNGRAEELSFTQTMGLSADERKVDLYYAQSDSDAPIAHSGYGAEPVTFTAPELEAAA